MEKTPLPLIKSKNNEKLDKNSVKIKICKYLRSQKLDLYELKMDFFDNDDMEKFLLFSGTST